MNLSAAPDTQFLPLFPALSHSGDLQIPLFPIVLSSFSASSSLLSLSILLLALLPSFLHIVSKRPFLSKNLIAIMWSRRQQRVNDYKILIKKDSLKTCVLDWFLRIPKGENIFATTEWTLWEQHFRKDWRRKLCLKMQMAEFISSVLLAANPATETIQIFGSCYRVRSYSMHILNEQKLKWLKYFIF